MYRPSPPAVDLAASLPHHLRLQTVALDGLVLADRKLRKHPASQIRKIARSLETFGWVTPIVIDEPAQSVRMPPGSRTVTSTPNGAISWARPLENPAMAHFAAWQA